MASKTLVLLGLFALVLVVSESAVASRTQPDMVKPKEETVQPNQQAYGGNGGNGAIGYGGGGARPCCSHAGEAVQTQPGH